MIPVRLSVRNFMCYRGDASVLELEDVHLACLSGENGAGKSALLGAITWALWGKARDRVSDDELISQGASDMEVDYEFILGPSRYKVIRKRARKSGGTTILDLHVQTDGDTDTWKPMTGHTVRDTQAKISELLKMEYETFINSAFILQGRADEFTLKTGTERKKVLADILGLAEYDRLEDAAKEEARDRKSGMMELDNKIKSIDGELLLRPKYTQDLEALEAEFAIKQQDFSTLKEELGKMQMQRHELQSSVQRLEELQKRDVQRKQDIQDAQRRIGSNDTRKAELESLLSRRGEIEKGYHDLQTAQAEVGRLVETMQDMHVLEKEQARHEAEINSERVRLSSQQDQYTAQIREIERNLAGRSVVERQLAEILEKLSKLERVKGQHEDSKCAKENLDTKIRVLTSEMVTLEKDGKVLGEKLKLIVDAHADGKGHAKCPLCDTNLTMDALNRVQSSYDEDIKLKRQEYERKRNEQRALNEEMVAADSRMQVAAEELKALPMNQKREIEYNQTLARLDKDQETLDKLQAQLAAVQKQQAESDFAHEGRKALADVKGQIVAIDFSREALDVAQQRVAELGPYNDRYHKLEGAEKDLASVREWLKADNSSLSNWLKEQEREAAEIIVLLPQSEQLEALKQDIAVKQQAERMLDDDVSVLNGNRGELRGKIARCDALQEEKQRYMEQYKVAAEEKGIFDELTTAFGKKGIQAMIIENIIPDLEQEANALLNRMTDGRMSVQFATQRDAKSSKKDVIETLDINISDDVGTRAYELYSGGEAFRANFAVRIALSKLLARRAGAQLQMLVIDEGFGTQDGQGRDKLVSAIRSIQDDFQKILVVTHIEELKNEFPIRIDVVKTEMGSSIVVN